LDLENLKDPLRNSQREIAQTISFNYMQTSTQNEADELKIIPQNELFVPIPIPPGTSQSRRLALILSKTLR